MSTLRSREQPSAGQCPLRCVSCLRRTMCREHVPSKPSTPKPDKWSPPQVARSQQCHLIHPQASDRRRACWRRFALTSKRLQLHRRNQLHRLACDSPSHRHTCFVHVTIMRTVIELQNHVDDPVPRVAQRRQMPCDACRASAIRCATSTALQSPAHPSRSSGPTTDRTLAAAPPHSSSSKRSTPRILVARQRDDV
jgi:hypothetical protein